MSTGNGKAVIELRVRSLRFTKDRVVVALNDEREISVPLERYPTLKSASRAQREKWKMLGDGIGFHWPALDLDLSVDGLLMGLPERIPAPPAQSKSKTLRRQSA